MCHALHNYACASVLIQCLVWQNLFLWASWSWQLIPSEFTPTPLSSTPWHTRTHACTRTPGCCCKWAYFWLLLLKTSSNTNRSPLSLHSWSLLFDCMSWQGLCETPKGDTQHQTTPHRCLHVNGHKKPHQSTKSPLALSSKVRTYLSGKSGGERTVATANELRGHPHDSSIHNPSLLITSFPITRIVRNLLFMRKPMRRKAWMVGRKKTQRMTEWVVLRATELPQLLFPVVQGAATQTTS